MKNEARMCGTEFGILDATEDVPIDELLKDDDLRVEDEGRGGGGKSGALVSGERYVTLGLRLEDEDESFGIGTMGLVMTWEGMCVDKRDEMDVDWARGDGVDGLKWMGQRDPGTVAEARAGSSTSIIVVRCWSANRAEWSLSDGRR